MCLPFCMTKSIMKKIEEVCAMARIGRPKSEQPRIKTISVRVTIPEFEKLKEYASKNNLTITQSVHKGIDTLYQKP